MELWARLWRIAIWISFARLREARFGGRRKIHIHLWFHASP
jgi:hypothetical protein